MKEETALGVILARGGSKRVPKKNIKPLGGKPLIAYTIEAAKQSKLLTDYLVSTDDEEIELVCRNYNAPVPFKRPAEISEDIDSALPLNHALQWYEQTHNQKINWVVCLQPTSPFRTSNDIDNCIQIAKATNADTVISVAKATQHPYWCFEMKRNQELIPFMDIQLQGDVLVSQNLPLVLYPNGALYVTKANLIKQNILYGEKIHGYMMPRERSIDLEEQMDFLVASSVMAMNREREGVWEKISWWID